VTTKGDVKLTKEMVQAVKLSEDLELITYNPFVRKKELKAKLLHENDFTLVQL